jgi:broad specificity phosphatase PhoE
MELYLIRHGQSKNNAHDDAHVHADPDLTELGHRQADRLAAWLSACNDSEAMTRRSVRDPLRKDHHPVKLTHIYVSPMRRALQTALPLMQTFGVQPVVHPTIYEAGGLFERTTEGGIRPYRGMGAAEIRAEFPGYVLDDSITDDGWYTLDREEMLAECHLRADQFAQMLRQQVATDEYWRRTSVAMVSHGMFIDCLLLSLMGVGPHNRQSYFWVYNTSITRVDLQRDGYAIIRAVNRVPHLPHEMIT